MLDLELPPDLEIRLEKIAEEAGRTKDECIRDAVRRYVEDGEDALIARERLARPGRRWTLEELEAERDLLER